MYRLAFDPVVPRQVRSFSLEGTTYRIALRWDVRLSAWYLDLRDADDTPIVSGVRVAAGAILVRDMDRSDLQAPAGGVLAAFGRDGYVREDLSKPGGIEIYYMTYAEYLEILEAIDGYSEDVLVT